MKKILFAFTVVFLSFFLLAGCADSTCVFVGYFIKPQAIISEVECNGVQFKRKKMFAVIIKYVAPICIVLILISSVLDAFGIFKL